MYDLSVIIKRQTIMMTIESDRKKRKDVEKARRESGGELNRTKGNNWSCKWFWAFRAGY